MIDWKERYMREVEGLNNEGDPIGGDPPSGLRHQVEALKAENTKLENEIYTKQILELKKLTFETRLDNFAKEVEENNGDKK